MSVTDIATGCAVQVAGVSKSFRRHGKQHVVLDNVSLDIGASEIVSIIGRSGVGKSTFLRLVCGLDEADAGSVVVNDVPAGVARQQKDVGFMPQTSALLPWLTVRQNVLLVQKVNVASNRAAIDVDDVLDEVGLLDYAGAHPAQLSGGMRHRVALARALAVGGPLLALDEPFGSLDELTREALYDLVLRTWQHHQRTIVLVTHNLDEAVLLSDRVVVLGGTPAIVKGVVDVPGERPRRDALDEGVYAEVLASIRSLLGDA